MPHIATIVVYISLFTSLYFEVFLLITYFERRDDIQAETARSKRMVLKYPSVTFLVPCWNEETTVGKTVDSLLRLNYPKDKLKIIIIDDGSTDHTWEVIQKFTSKKQVEVYHKENGGKHSALNFGLSKTTSEFVGCLDADSYIDKDALKHIVVYFEDKEVMAVTPSVKIWKPQTIIQLIQRVEYGWGIFTRKMFSYLGALYVTPGPASIFRKSVFDTLGGYRYAHQTEDMEMALRMQSNHYKIVNAHNAIVYTVAPNTVRKLYKQRLRWTHGFIKNAIDYKYIFFNKKYGNLGVFILPMATLSILSAIYVLTTALSHGGVALYNEYKKVSIVGFNFHVTGYSFDWFSINTEFVAILSVIAFLGTLTLVLISRKMSEGKLRIGTDLVYFVALYAFLSPLWLSKAVYNALFRVKTTWR